jgi:hypothetical protein
MIRFRTGPVRTVLAAGALASSLGKELPALIPIGLHFRVREYFRTDVWVEYGEPIQILKSDIPDELIEAVSKGSWSEPPAENVFNLRDRLRLEMEPLTPNVAEWEEYRALHLLGHQSRRIVGDKPKSWKEEVLAAREIREIIVEPKKSIINDEPKPKLIEHEIIKPAISASNILHQNGLDGRDLNSKGNDIRFANITHLPLSLLRTSAFILLLPIFLLSLGPQVVLGRILGDSTDEGVDARTSYQFLASMFGSLIFWPIASTILVLIGYFQESNLTNLIGFDWTEVLGSGVLFNSLSIVMFWVICFPVFWLSGKLGSLAWDDYTYLRNFVRRRTMPKADRHNLKGLMKILTQEIKKM